MRLKLFLIFGILLISSVFVFAISYDLVTSGQTAEAEDTVSLLTFNMSNTTGVGENATLDSITLDLIGTASSGNITNVTVSDGSVTYYNSSISFPLLIQIDKNITGETNFTLNFTLSSSATWNETFGVNVTTITNSTTNASNTYVNYDTLPYVSGVVRVADSTNPSVTGPTKTSSTRTSITISYSCSDSFSDIASCVASSSSGSVSGNDITGLSCGLNYDITVTATDNEGLTASNTESLATQGCGGGSSNIPINPKNSHSWTLITPGIATIMKDFDSEIGVKQIEITVVNDAQNVKITVTKYSAKPASVSVEKSGKVFQYLQINEENLGSNLDKATVQFRVEKSWLNQNSLSKEEISVFRFNENSRNWDKLTTTNSGSDEEYEYYDVELEGFSYFAIAEGLVDSDSDGSSAITDTDRKNKGLVWVLVVLIILVIYFVFKLKFLKKKK